MATPESFILRPPSSERPGSATSSSLTNTGDDLAWYTCSFASNIDGNLNPTEAVESENFTEEDRLLEEYEDRSADSAPARKPRQDKHNTLSESWAGLFSLAAIASMAIAIAVLARNQQVSIAALARNQQLSIAMHARDQQVSGQVKCELLCYNGSAIDPDDITADFSRCWLSCNVAIRKNAMYIELGGARGAR